MFKNNCLPFILIIILSITNSCNKSAIKMENETIKEKIQHTTDIKTTDKIIKTNVTCGGNLSN